MAKFFYFLLLLSCFHFSGCDYASDKLVGVKMYTIPDDPLNVIHQWHQMGINTAFVSKALLMNDEFRNAAKDNDIQIFLIAPVFYNPEKLEQNSNWFAINQNGGIAKKDWVEFICPTQSAYHTILADSLSQIIKTYQPDGLSIDFIRHFLYWEMVHPNTDLSELPQTCFCSHCVNEFSVTESISLKSPIDSTSAVASEILSVYNVQWQAWRQKIITDAFVSLAHEVKKIKTDLKINLHAVPWLPDEENGQLLALTGQNVKAIAPHCTYISPMCYHFMVYQSVGWIADRVEGLNQLAPGKVLPSIQVGNAYRNEKISVGEYEQSIEQSLVGNSRGVVLWSWDLLEKEPEKKKVNIR